MPTIRLYSVVINNKLLLHSNIQIYLKNSVMLKMIWTPSEHNVTFHFYENLKKEKLIYSDRYNISDCLGLGIDKKVDRGTFWGDRNNFNAGHSGICIFQNSSNLYISFQ